MPTKRTPKSANRRRSDSKKKRKAPSTAWQPGQSGNPAGRPKDGESWAAISKSVGDMLPTELLELVGDTTIAGKILSSLPPKVQMKYLIMAQAFAFLAIDPNPKLLVAVMDRAEGKPKEQIDLTSKGKRIVLTDAERLARLTALLDGVRARRAGLSPDADVSTGSEAAVGPS